MFARLVVVSRHINTDGIREEVYDKEQTDGLNKTGEYTDRDEADLPTTNRKTQRKAVNNYTENDILDI